MTHRGNYRPIHEKMLDEPRFKELSREARLAWFYLRLRLGTSGIGLIFEGQLRDAAPPGTLDELEARGFLRREGELHWLVDALEAEATTSSYQATNGNRRTNIEKHLRSLPEQPLANEFAWHYGLKRPFPHLQLDEPDNHGAVLAGERDERSQGIRDPVAESRDWNRSQMLPRSLPNPSRITEPEPDTETQTKERTHIRKPGIATDQSGEEKRLREEARPLILHEMLMGQDPAVTKGGRELTVDDQLKTWDRMIAEGQCPEMLNGTVRHLRAVLEGDLATEPVGFGLLKRNPAIWNQATSAWEKSLPVPSLARELSLQVESASSQQGSSVSPGRRARPEAEHRSAMTRLKNPRHERFCQLFVHGNPHHDPEDENSPPETLHTANQSYMQAGYKARDVSARVLGSRLLSRGDVQARIEELREEAKGLSRLRTFHWLQLLPDAQEVLVRALRGHEVSTAAIQAAKIVIERAEGPLRYRFAHLKAGESKEALQVYIYGGSDDEDDFAHPEVE